MTLTHNYIKKAIKKYGLKPALKRDLSLFSSSCIGIGYTRSMKEHFGIYYNAYAAISKRGDYHSMINVPAVGRQVDKIFSKGESYLKKKILPQALRLFNESEILLKELRKKRNSDLKKSLLMITEAYPKYCASIGLYNAFMRYFEFRRRHSYPISFIEGIGKVRNRIAELYPKLEILFRKYAGALAGKMGVEKDTFYYCTASELKKFLRNEFSLDKIKKNAAERRRCYFHLVLPQDEKEYVWTEPKEINRVLNELFSVKNSKIKVFKGQSAWPGKIKGRVMVLDGKNKKISSKGIVLVASMTHPKDLSLIKKSIAIITDEGGILSHAAIISRELKKPCVVGTKIATKILKDGDEVEVDANKGIVKIIKKA